MTRQTAPRPTGTAVERRQTETPPIPPHGGARGYRVPVSDAATDTRRYADRWPFSPRIGIQTVCSDHTFYRRSCGAMASAKTCPHHDGVRVAPYGTRVRELPRAGELPPPEFSRPKVVRVLADGPRERVA